MKKKEIKALCSNVILSDKTVVTFNDLSESNKDEIRLELCQHISQQISTYYSSHIEEWHNFKTKTSIIDRK